MADTAMDDREEAELSRFQDFLILFNVIFKLCIFIQLQIINLK